MGDFKTLVKVMAIVLPVVGVVAYNNLSTAIIILGIAVCMLFVASPKYSHFLIVGGVVLAVGVIFIALASYRAERIQIWLHPEEYEKVIRRCRDSMRSVPAGCSARDSGRACRSSVLSRRRRTI